MMKKITIVAGISTILLAAACKSSVVIMNADKKEKESENKIIELRNELDQLNAEFDTLQPLIAQNKPFAAFVV